MEYRHFWLLPRKGRSSWWKYESAGQILKEGSQEPCTQPQASAGWWSSNFLQSTRVWQSWMCARQEHDAFCEILDLSVPICKWEVGISPQIHSGSTFPCFLSHYPVKCTDLFLSGRRKQWDRSSLYSGSNLGPIVALLLNEPDTMLKSQGLRPLWLWAQSFMDVGTRVGFLLSNFLANDEV